MALHNKYIWVIALLVTTGVSGQRELDQVARKLNTVNRAASDGFLRKLSLAEHKIRFVRLLEEGHPTAQRTTLAPDGVTKVLVSDECGADIAGFLEGLAQGELWAIQMLDATAKPPSGILDGALVWPGLYKKCRNIKTNQNTVGNYCAATLTSTQNTSTPLAQVSAGLCLPQSCTETDVLALTEIILSSTIYDILFHKHGLTQVIQSGEFQSISAGSSPESLPTTSASGIKPKGTRYGTGSISVSFEEEELHNASRSCYEKRQSKAIQCYLAFSAYTNACKILTVSGLSKDRTLAPIHGIRFISMTWVILGHSLVYGISVIGNISIIFDFSQDFAFQAILNASVSVDTFFLISGALMAFLMLAEMDKRGDPFAIPWHKVYFHRFWRLTPPYMLVIGAYTALYEYLGEGPFWQQHNNMVQLCRDNWWQNLLYINNFSNPMKLCMGHTWYLANDMQFFVLSPLFLIPLFLKPIVGFVLISLATSASMASVIILTLQKDLPIAFPSLLDPVQGANFVEYMTNVYLPFWARIGPYLIGILLGYALFYTSNAARKYNQTWFFLAFVVTSYAAAFVFSLLFEAPMIGLEKVLVGSK
ncbi:hypothetical protein CAPTEDRAFT_222179 [Capitella teleta]|uniref:Nose resistant-to-fluoxetine protein N-terminal domain-containing protein n=1 Tax=Capitella teleta TaxID=283909 RepID=R7UGD7_CAPTE|nr:hypothetical protein CAPTEDRAFT_222179 [Capitella teleta]|eukprot:ELU05579.1 hypothetical protein CAPTEDRAFT_222179 [Capitella teleta]